MKITTIVFSLASLSQAALADDLTTPTPTPTPAIYLGRPRTVWREEQLQRRNEHQSAADARAQARAKQKSHRLAAETAQAQAKEADRGRERAQHEVAAENRRETRNQKPHLTSDLMSRMGFSEKEIADQKAREQSASPTPPSH